jgi:hypothetical protein
MEGAVWVFGMIVFFAIIWYLFGLRIPVEGVERFFEHDVVLKIFQKGSLYLLFPVGVDVVLLGLLKIFYKSINR